MVNYRTARSLAAVLCFMLQRVHVVVGKAEMMADFVDQYVIDQLVQRHILSRPPFFQQRTAK